MLEKTADLRTDQCWNHFCIECDVYLWKRLVVSKRRRGLSEGSLHIYVHKE